jgi:hypothetical protein
MASRLRISGVVLIIIGIIAWGAAGYAYMRMQSGADALQGFSAAQDVTLSYNEDGKLVDRGVVQGEGDDILALLGDTWKWPIDNGELNPKDPIVNTATEYMYQMATIAYHTLHGTQNVVLTETVYWDGSSVVDSPPAGATTYSGGEWDPSTASEPAIFNPGTYTVPVDGRYWTGFNRLHPLDGPARELAWNGTVHGLFAELGVGATTATSLQMAFGIVGVTALMGLGFVVSGGALVWVGGAAKKEEQPAVA